MKVHWIKSQADTWLKFEDADLATVKGTGIYLIWQSGSSNDRVVYVGQGNVADRIACHRQERNMTRHGPMRFTWASVASQYRDGVERYLADKYSPLEGDHHPIAAAIAVNLPGE